MTALALVLAGVIVWLVLRLRSIRLAQDGDMEHLSVGWLEADRRLTAIAAKDGWR